METPNVERLREMPYSELKKIAKEHGIKGNLKAEKIISALASLSPDELESFFTPAQKEINSSKKNKEEKFNEDMATPLATPRRGTYSIGSPISLKVDDISPTSVSNDPTALDMCNVSFVRGSERKLRPRKVSFMSPVVTPRTPKNSNLKYRPKTPIASAGKRTSPAPTRQSRRLNGTPPQPLNSISETDTCKELIETASLDVNNETSNLPIKEDCSKSLPSDDANQSITMKAVVSKGETSTRIRKLATPRSAKSLGSKEEMSAKVKRIATPNFKKIHMKAFEKMESIDDYQKRKMESAKKVDHVEFKSKVTKAKGKIPALSGIPFIPSVSRSTHNLHLNLSTRKTTPGVKQQKGNFENAPQRSKSKFDLKASLSRKLGYKPYTGRLKPLAESNAVNTPNSTCLHTVKVPVNKVVNAKRSQNLAILKGVRTNKRFELQMKNRNLE